MVIINSSWRKNDESVLSRFPGVLRPFKKYLEAWNFTSENESRNMIYSEEIVFQVGVFCPITLLSVIVLMGGLALPEVPVKLAPVHKILTKYLDVARVGTSLIHKLKQPKWLDKISFDLMICDYRCRCHIPVIYHKRGTLMRFGKILNIGLTAVVLADFTGKNR